MSKILSCRFKNRNVDASTGWQQKKGKNKNKAVIFKGTRLNDTNESVGWLPPPGRCHTPAGLRPPLQYLLVLPDAVVAAEAFLLAVHQQEVVGRRPAGQVVAALLAAVHDQAVGPAVHVETLVAADLVGHILKANLMPDLWTGKRNSLQRTFRSLLGQSNAMQFQSQLVAVT